MNYRGLHRQFNLPRENIIQRQARQQNEKKCVIRVLSCLGKGSNDAGSRQFV